MRTGDKTGGSKLKLIEWFPAGSNDDDVLSIWC